MSVKIMSMIFDTEINTLSFVSDGKNKNVNGSTCKIVLLAIGDNANDEGESAYPGLSRLETKTALTRQGLLNAIKALEANGYICVDRASSKHGTNTYKINQESIGVVNRVDQGSQPGLLGVVNRVDQGSQPGGHDPSFNHHINHPLTIRDDNEQPQDQTDTQRPNIFALYEQVIGPIPQNIADDLVSAETDYHPDWIEKAFRIAAENNARNWRYVSACLRNMKTRGVDWKPRDKYNNGKRPNNHERVPSGA